MRYIVLVTLATVLLTCTHREDKQPPLIRGQNDEGSSTPPERDSWLSRYDLSDKSPTQFKLPKRLSEASGLSMSDDGRLFSHDDENGVVYQVDYTSGKIVKRFFLGTFTITGDFEGMATKGRMFYLVISNGDILEFREGKDEERVSYHVYKTLLTQANDVEGLEYDKSTDCLLLLCKGYPGKGLSGYKGVYAFSLKTKALEQKPRLLISLKAVKKVAHKGEFNPSGVAIHPVSRTYFIISADGHSIVEMTTDGVILGQQEIPREVNSQPEGITFAPDNTMIICNDGQGKTGTLTLYPLKK